MILYTCIRLPNDEIEIKIADNDCRRIFQTQILSEKEAARFLVELSSAMRPSIGLNEMLDRAFKDMDAWATEDNIPA